MGSSTTCVNHPHEETRVTCSACGDPICIRCMRQSAVGQKCPSCARVPRSARALGRPRHYVKAGAVGVATAGVGGVVLGEFVAAVAFGNLILAGLYGFGAGRAVKWAASGQTSQPFVAIAVGTALAGVMVAFLVLTGFTTFLPASPWLLLSYPIAGWFAARGAQG